MIVAFVGFVGAWTKARSAPRRSWPPACSARRWPRGSPSCRRSSSSSRAARSSSARATTSTSRAPLTAITAAVVGVIANLAVFFAWHVFWPGASAAVPFPRAIDLPSVGIAALALAALVTNRAGTIPVIAGSALAGVALKALGA